MGVGAFEVTYHELVAREDVSKLATTDKIRIQRAIEEKLADKPEIFGKPLRRSLKGYRKLRVGDYRIIFRIEKQLVKIFCIGHRSVVYKHRNRRMAVSSNLTF